MRDKSIIAGLALYLVVAGSGCGEGVSSESGEVPLPGLGLRVAVEPIAPIAVAESEGADHLIYELQISSYDPRSLYLDSLEVIGVGHEETRLRLLKGAELSRVTLSPGRPDARGIAPGSLSVVFLAVATEGEAPDSLFHRLWLHELANGAPAELSTTPLPIERSYFDLLSPPLMGGPWYAHAGPADISHHRTTLAPRGGLLSMDQRFAIDWFLLDVSEGEQGQAVGGPDWRGTIEAEVVAVADGVVAAVKTGVADEPIGELGASGTRINWETISGNRVVIDLRDGRYAWYHHLLDGSLTVEEGDSVARGQILGRVGNSGQTSHPHLHFEVTDANALGLGNGLPYRLTCFDQLSRISPMPGWFEVAESDPSEIGFSSLPFEAVRLTRSVAELPLGGAIVWFPQVPAGECAWPGG